MEYIALSKEPFDKTKFSDDFKELRNNKPSSGLWFSKKEPEDSLFESEWHSFCYNEYSSWLQKNSDNEHMGYAIEVELNEDANICVIDSQDDMRRLYEKYGKIFFEDSKEYILNWKQLAHDYDGVEVTETGLYSNWGTSRDRSVGLDQWCIPSFVLFNPNCVKNFQQKQIELLSQEGCKDEIVKLSENLENPITIENYMLQSLDKYSFERSNCPITITFGGIKEKGNEVIVDNYSPYRTDDNIYQIIEDLNYVLCENCHPSFKAIEVLKILRMKINEREKGCEFKVPDTTDNFLKKYKNDTPIYYNETTFDSLMALEAIRREAIKYNAISPDQQIKASPIESFDFRDSRREIIILNGKNSAENNKRRFVLNPEGDTTLCQWLVNQEIHIPEQILEWSKKGKTIGTSLEGFNEKAKEIWNAAENNNLQKYLQQEPIIQPRENTRSDNISKLNNKTINEYVIGVK